jgi:hypothetical protein
MPLFSVIAVLIFLTMYKRDLAKGRRNGPNTTYILILGIIGVVF